MKPAVLLVILAMGVLLVPEASAHGGGVGYRGPVHPYRSAPLVRVRPAPVIVYGSIGYGWGVPFGAGGYGWPGPIAPYYGPTVITVPAQPQTYVEQGSTAPATPVPGYWYWCADPHGYFPDVRECAGGWQAVMPRNEQQPSSH